MGFFIELMLVSTVSTLLLPLYYLHHYNTISVDFVASCDKKARFSFFQFIFPNAYHVKRQSRHFAAEPFGRPRGAGCETEPGRAPKIEEVSYELRIVGE